jgi:Tol biopolymer transport system component
VTRPDLGALAVPVVLVGSLVCAGAGAASASLDTARRTSIYVVGVDGKGRRNLTPSDSQPDVSPRVSPDGTTIAYLRLAPGNGESFGRIWMMKADGTGKRQLTPEPSDLESQYDLVWSPNGKMIAFSVRHEPTTCPPRYMTPYCPVFAVEVRDAQTGALIQAFRDAQHPTWSPTSTRVAFERGIDPRGDFSAWLYVGTLDGKEAQLGQGQIGPDGVDILVPSWSPTGRQIAFDGFPNVGAPTAGFFLFDMKRGLLKRLTPPPASSYGEPVAWSPCGDRLAATGQTGVDVLGLHRGQWRRLGDRRGSYGGVAWSRNGTQIATFKANPYRLVVLSVRTGTGRTLSRGDPYSASPNDSRPPDVAPAWSPDGKKLYFAASM